MVDIWRALYPDKHGYTFYHRDLKSSRLDYVFVSRSIYCYVLNADISSLGLTDHFAVTCLLEKCDIVKGPGTCIWICDNSLMSDDQCIEHIQTFWRYWQNSKE